jgi:hypothetical protein
MEILFLREYWKEATQPTRLHTPQTKIAEVGLRLVAEKRVSLLESAFGVLSKAAGARTTSSRSCLLFRNLVVSE